MIGAIFELHKEKREGKLIGLDGKVRIFKKDFSKKEIKPFQEVNFNITKNEEDVENIITDIEITNNQSFPVKLPKDTIKTGESLKFKDYFKKNKKNIFNYFLFSHCLFLLFFGALFLILDEFEFWWNIIDNTLYSICSILFGTKEDYLLTNENWFQAELTLFLIVFLFYEMLSIKTWYSMIKKEYKELKHCLFQIDLINALPLELKDIYIKEKNKYGKI